MNVLVYISGFIIKKLLHKVDCDVCRDALIYDPKDSAGGVFLVVRQTETAFRFLFLGVSDVRLLRKGKILTSRLNIMF